MWIRELGHLLAKGWFLMVTATGTNTLGFIVWTLALTIFTWFATIIQQTRQLKSNGSADPFLTAFKGSVGSGLYSFAGIIALALIAWAISVVVAVYKDHVALVESNSQLTKQLAAWDENHITLRINGWISNQDQNHNAIVQVWLAVDNTGEPSVLRDWKITLKIGNLLREGRNSVGQAPLKGSLTIPFLDREFQRPVGTVADMQGYITFGLPGINGKDFADLYLDRSATLIVSARDSHGRTISAEKNIYETWLEGHETRPAH